MALIEAAKILLSIFNLNQYGKEIKKLSLTELVQAVVESTWTDGSIHGNLASITFLVSLSLVIACLCLGFIDIPFQCMI